MEPWKVALADAEKTFNENLERIRQEEYQPVGERVAKRVAPYRESRDQVVLRAYEAGADLSFIAYNLGVSRNTVYAITRGLL